MKQNLILIAIKKHLIYYPTPINLTYFWNFGSLAGFCLIIQILSGLFLAMHYSADVTLAFNSVEHIMRDVNFGWLLRYTHANGASMFLLVIYLHMARGLFFRSYLYPREHLWYSGVLLFVLLMATAFLGYVLPWGQMSFWGATVITNLASAIPIIGQTIAYWLWGGFAIDNATLTRFFSLHFLIPFVMAGVSLIHLALLHDIGSSNPLGVESIGDFIPFYPYFLLKDIFGFLVFLILFSYLVFFEPNLLGHPDNYIKANPLVTPPHIVPEWYFLPFYAILRAVPDKLGGVAAMGAAIGILFFLPALHSRTAKILFIIVNSSLLNYFLSSKLHKFLSSEIIEPKVMRFASFSHGNYNFFFLWVISFLFLGVLGAKPVEWPYNTLSVFMTVFYFSFFFFWI